MHFKLMIAAAAAWYALPFADVSGTVKDDKGAPVVGAFVRFVPTSDSAGEVSGLTDAQGHYSLKLSIASGILRREASAFSDAGPAGFRYDLRGRQLDAKKAIAGAWSLFAANAVAGSRASAARKKTAGAATQTFLIQVNGKGIYPFEARSESVADGETRDFALKHIDAWDSARTILRSSLANCRYQFENRKSGRVVFLGGSITFNPGWRDSVSNYLKKRYPQTVFDFINAGIPSVGSDMHGFRLEKDVFYKGQVDLLFYESAVNDTTNGIPSLIRTRAYEGIVRQARRRNPDIDIVYMYFADDVFYQDVAANKPIPLITDYEKSAVQYGISSINLAQFVAEHYTWQTFGGDVHAGAFGQGIYTKAITGLLTASWSDSASVVSAAAPHFTSPKPMDSLCFSQGHFDSLPKATLINGWKYVADWKPDSGGTRDGFTNVPVLEAKTPGDTLKFAFTGTAIGIVIPSGWDAGMLDYAIDGKWMGSKDTWTPWSPSLYLPWTPIFATDLTNASHVLTLVTSKNKNANSGGYATRIIRFAVNGPH